MKSFEQIYQQSLKEVLALESPNVVSYFKELDLIKNKTKKEKLMSILRTSAYKNISGATSSTGKYHPKFANTSFGLSKHTKAVVKFMLTICDAFEELDRDTMIIAAIAHDAFKYLNDDSDYTSKHHAKEAADKLRSVGLNDEARLVASHMGRWSASKDEPPPQKFDEKMLHLADFIASKKFISINFDENNNLLEESMRSFLS
jgi:putative nucleotidyltransferase with HDIG domain